MSAFDGSTATALGLGRSVLEALLGHASNASPHEACGVLHGRYDDEGMAVVAGGARLPDVAIDPTHTYRLDEAHQAQVWNRVREKGDEVLAIWHTHPNGPETPSETDLEYMQPWHLYVIVSMGPSVGGLPATLRVWRLADGGAPEEVPVRLGA